MDSGIGHETNFSSAGDLMASMEQKSDGKKRYWLTYFRLLAAILVVAAVVYTVISSAHQIQTVDFQLNSLNYSLLALAMAAYIVALWLASLFWKKVLVDFGCRPSWRRTLTAFFLSQLGKYVPGKAMVVVIRTDVIRDQEIAIGPAAASVFVETLTWIFVGSVIASILIAFRFSDQLALQWTAIGMAVVFGCLTWPPVFRFITGRLASDASSVSVASLRLRTMIFGWCVMTVAWLLNGLSLWLVLASLPGTNTTIGDFPLALACVSLSTVVGFVSLIPGGIGVRELVMIPLLAPRFETGIAIISAILIRILWMSAELLCSGIIYLAWRTDMQNPQSAKE